MRWLKKDLRKVGIALAGVLLLLVLMAWLPLSVAGAHEMIPVLAASVTVQATPTEDATVTALNKEKLAQEVKQLKNQNEPDLFEWLRMNASILLSTLVVVIGGLIGLWRWLGDRRSEREKREEEQQRWLQDRQAEREKQLEERFQSVVEGLGSSSLATQIGAAITLRIFLHTDYEQFHNQAFDLAVAHLRLRNVNPEVPEPLNSLSQALIVVFKESFHLTRDRLKQNSQFLDAARIQLDNAYLSSVDLQKIWMPESILRRANLNQANLNQANLNQANLTEANLQQANLSEATLIGATLIGATLIGATLSQTDFRRAVLDGAKLSEANLSGANLKNVDLRKVKLYKVDLSGANLSGANLSGANLSGIRLNGANLSGANLSEAKLDGALLIETDLSWTNLNGANLSKAKLYKARLVGSRLINTNLNGADLSRVKLINANLNGADLSRAKLYGTIIEKSNLSNTTLTDTDLSEAKLGHVDLSGSKLGGVNSSSATTRISFNMSATKMTSVKGLTKEQLELCKAKGAIIDEDSMVSLTQSAIPSLPPLQSNNIQVPSAPTAQGSTPIPDTEGGSATPSKLGSES